MEYEALNDESKKDESWENLRRVVTDVTVLIETKWEWKGRRDR